MDDEISDMNMGTIWGDKVEYWDVRNAYFKVIAQKLTICPRGYRSEVFSDFERFHCIGVLKRGPIIVT